MRASNNTLAINPIHIAKLVVATTHLGSLSSIVRSPISSSRHLSAHPESAMRVIVGPKPPHIRGVMEATYCSHVVPFREDVGASSEGSPKEKEGESALEENVSPLMSSSSGKEPEFSRRDDRESELSRGDGGV